MLPSNMLPATSNMLPGNMLLVAGNILPVSRQYVSLCIHQQTVNKLATILLPETCCLLPATGNMLPGNMLPWCKRGLRKHPGDRGTYSALAETLYRLCENVF